MRVVNKIFFFFSAETEGPGFCAFALTAFAGLLLIITLPFSLCTCIKESIFTCYDFKGIVQSAHQTYMGMEMFLGEGLDLNFRLGGGQGGPKLWDSSCVNVDIHNNI